MYICALRFIETFSKGIGFEFINGKHFGLLEEAVKVEGLLQTVRNANRFFFLVAFDGSHVAYSGLS